MEWMRIIKISKSFGVRRLFQNVSFDVKRGERIGLVGPNGVGKSTLLKCILGKEEIDRGQIYLTDGATLGYLAQDVNLGNSTLREEMSNAWKDVLNLEERIKALTKKMEIQEASEKDLKQLANMQERFEYLGGYNYEAMSKSIVYSLGFTDEDLDTPAQSFSGGQKTRINVAKALVRRPDFLLLDEPTNHLDMEMLAWLEGYLSSFDGGILVVSHDRYFLDKVCTGIVELNHEKATVYNGNYSRYLVQKEAREKAQRRAYEKQQEHIRKTEEYIDKYRAGIKSKMARGRQSQLDRLERIEAVDTDQVLQFEFPKPTGSADKVLVLNDISIGYGDNPILEHIKLLIRRGEAVSLIGPNGAGKSTLVKTIMGELDLLDGIIDIGDRVKIGYFSQEHKELNDEWEVIEEIMNHSGFSEGQARNVLGRFLFRGDAVFRKVGDLSGGEKARLALLKLFLEGNNFLILDEPTNHLDIPTREIVEEALNEFGGTYLVISHDRYFLDKISRRTLSLEDGEIKEYLGNYSYYREKLAERQELLALAESEMQKDKPVVKTKVQPLVKEVKEEVEPQKNEVKEEKPKLNDFMREKKIKEVETQIARLEATIKMYEVQIEGATAMGDFDELTKLGALMDKANQDLEAKFEVWENLQEE